MLESCQRLHPGYPKAWHVGAGRWARARRKLCRATKATPDPNLEPAVHNLFVVVREKCVPSLPTDRNHLFLTEDSLEHKQATAAGRVEVVAVCCVPAHLAHAPHFPARNMHGRYAVRSLTAAKYLRGICAAKGHYGIPQRVARPVAAPLLPDIELGPADVAQSHDVVWWVFVLIRWLESEIHMIHRAAADFLEQHVAIRRVCQAPGIQRATWPVKTAKKPARRKCIRFCLQSFEGI